MAHRARHDRFRTSAEMPAPGAAHAL